jgi:radical SAM superfamily enzyme YgiQ (UPF0313 family)
MTRVVFVEPTPAFNGYGFVRLPLMGLLYLGTILKGKSGLDVSVLSERTRRVYHAKSGSIDESLKKADIVGISSMTSTAGRTYAIARAVRKENPKARIILGGPHPTFLPEEGMEFADLVVRGEAESIIECAVEGGYPDGIVDGKRVESLDSLPIPDFDVSPGLRKGLKWIPISSSRGCPHDCCFCSVTKMFGRRYRFRSPLSVIEEVERRLWEGHSRFFFYDDNFTANPVRTREFLEETLRRKLKFRWVAQTRVEVAQDPDMLDLMARSGCEVLFFGFESVNSQTLDLYNKHQTPRDIEACVRNCREKGIDVCGMFVIGADEDDDSTVWETADFLRACRPEYAQFSVLCPLPGTEFHKQVEREGRILTRDWSQYDGTHVVFRPKKFSPLELQRKVLDLWGKFYSFGHVKKFLVYQYFLLKWKFANKKFMSWLQDLQALERYSWVRHPHLPR